MVEVALLVAAVWSSWFNAVAATNLSRGSSVRQRLCVLSAMAGIAVAAAGIPGIVDGDRLTFAAGFAIARTAIAPLWVDERREKGLGPWRPVLFGPVWGLGWVARRSCPACGPGWCGAPSSSPSSRSAPSRRPRAATRGLAFGHLVPVWAVLAILAAMPVVMATLLSLGRRRFDAEAGPRGLRGD